MRAVEFVANAYDSYEYKRKFDAAYIAGQYNRVQHLCFFELIAPQLYCFFCLCVLSFFTKTTPVKKFMTSSIRIPNSRRKLVLGASMGSSRFQEDRATSFSL